MKNASFEYVFLGPECAKTMIFLNIGEYCMYFPNIFFDYIELFLVSDYRTGQLGSSLGPTDDGGTNLIKWFRKTFLLNIL